MNELILLGAGASVEAGIPGSHQMTQAIVEKFHQNPVHRQYVRVANFVIGGLLFQEGIRGHDPLDSGVNVESFFNAVQLLADRHTLEAAPFVGSWHSMVEEFDKVSPSFLKLDRLNEEFYKSVRDEILDAFSASPSSYEAGKIDKTLEKAISKVVEAAVKNRSVSFSTSESIGRAVDTYISQVVKQWTSKLKSSRPSSSSQLEKEFQKAVSESLAQPGQGRIFQQTAELMIRTLTEIVWVDSPDRVTYLNPILDFARSRKRLVIATLNYDNAIELAAGSQRVQCDTGIDGWSQAGIIDTTGECLHLLKLHGSIDWEWRRDVVTKERPLPHSTIHQVSATRLTEGGFRPAVIFGQRNKLTAEGPFLDLLRAFQQELVQATMFTVIGYSFGDDHVNTYISQWLNQSSEHRIRIVNPGFEKSMVPYVEHLKRLREERPEQIQVLADHASEGLLKLYGDLGRNESNV